MFSESRIQSIARWHLYRKWKKPQNTMRRAEYRFHKMMGKLPHGIALDLGANVGDVTNQVRKYGFQVIAFEPDPTAGPIIKKRFAHDPGVTVIPKAVGGFSRTTTFYHLPHFTIASSLSRTDEQGDDVETIQIEVVDIVEFIKSLRQPIALIKMDIEGAETECLEAIMREGLHRSIGYILVECHDWISPDVEYRLNSIRKKIDYEKIQNIDLNWI